MLAVAILEQQSSKNFKMQRRFSLRLSQQGQDLVCST